MSILHGAATADVLLLYPVDSLKDQIGFWASRHSQWQVETSSERSLPEIRALLPRAGVVLVDGTEDPAQATDAFLQAVARLGSAAVAMYTETTNRGLEVFVRMRGSPFLLGPLFDPQWEAFFNHLLHTDGQLPVARRPRRRSPSHLRSRQKEHDEWLLQRFRSRLDWPSTGIN